MSILQFIGNKKGLQNIATLCICCVFLVKTANALRTGSYGGLSPYHISYAQQRVSRVSGTRQLSKPDEDPAQTGLARG
jgi:hypothetical protein